MQKGISWLLRTWIMTWTGMGPLWLVAQPSHPLTNIHFYQLTTAEGLTDNYIYTMAIDQGGYLWIGSGEGLNRFNGKTVDKYFKAEYPALQSDYIRQIFCDAQNRLWISNGDGYVTLIDEERNFHRVALKENGKFEQTRVLLPTDQYGVVLFTRHHQLKLKADKHVLDSDTLRIEDFDALDMIGGDSLLAHSYTSVVRMSPNEYFFSNPKEMIRVDYAHNKVAEKITCQQCKPLCNWDHNQILLYHQHTKNVVALDPVTLTETTPFDGILDQHNAPLSNLITKVIPLHQDQYLLASLDAGLYLYTPSTHTLVNHQHNAADPTSLVNNHPDVICYDSTGWVFLGATPHGVSYFNQNAVIGQQLVFQDKKGNNYDGVVSNLATLDNDTYFIGTSDFLIKWTRSTNTSDFFTFPTPVPGSNVKSDVITHVTFDRFRRLWVGTRRSGIYVLDDHQRVLHHIPVQPEDSNGFFSGSCANINEGPDGNMWLCGSKGIARIDPITYKVVSLQHTQVGVLDGQICFRTEHFDDQTIWVCTNNHGAWKYNLVTDSLTKFNKSNGLPTNEVHCVNQDLQGNTYFGTNAGLLILFTNGTKKLYTEENGMLNRRVEAVIRDNENRMWLGNDVGLGCFNIADTTMRAFDERFGLSIQGFRLDAYYHNSNDELFWGTERGLQYYYPNDLYNQRIELKTLINQIDTRDVDGYLTESRFFKLAPGNNFVTFYFSTIDFSKHLHTFYQYQLTGLDPDWLDVTDQNSVRYSSLNPGRYTFKVRASNDKKNWVDAENEITIELEANFWEKAWFRSLAILGFCGLVVLVLSRISKKQKARTEAIETESVINYFASQINRHQRMENMLWDVAKNCISRLNLEECVIYLVDPERQMLVQKAAYGPKTISDETIHSPIEIPVGQGITGSVAATKKPEIVNNTEKDPRYIVDDVRRQSEMAVPIIVDSQVIGVIDSEHSQRNFFTPKHLSLMTTIAILTANQIQRILAEEEKQKAEIEILQNKQKATESRLQSLRLQMNPHFLFNALNSIQQMILANEEMVATRYLSRFSKLLRSILVHSDQEMISLKEELEILKLYVELESVRFKEAFSYEIICDEEIDVDEVKIPT
ncbi:MAG TPA: histidine kinase, partial [Saprospiraceae bacterium]|nr:histidine kinase [Saprospiraceae bacterium]